MRPVPKIAKSAQTLHSNAYCIFHITTETSQVNKILVQLCTPYAWLIFIQQLSELVSIMSFITALYHCPLSLLFITVLYHCSLEIKDQFGQHFMF